MRPYVLWALILAYLDKFLCNPLLFSIPGDCFKVPATAVFLLIENQYLNTQSILFEKDLTINYFFWVVSKKSYFCYAFF
ncbi:hypothetical protein LX64_03144 [Chitinophaga skermanii]|uniref:Uncharacterized protein n=1 Tax=Chitinophaga skermanii TaxID=331697 RepID=A0A327QKN1_9BACT|nr:hypothetical protein LX64_03144 [Chitinophaga skermanii]